MLHSEVSTQAEQVGCNNDTRCYNVLPAEQLSSQTASPPINNFMQSWKRDTIPGNTICDNIPQNQAADEIYEFAYLPAAAGALTQGSDNSVPEFDIDITDLMPLVPALSPKILDKLSQSALSVFGSNESLFETSQNFIDASQSTQQESRDAAEKSDDYEFTNLPVGSPQRGNSPVHDNAEGDDAAGVVNDVRRPVTPPPFIETDFVAVLADLGINIETDFQPGRNNRVLNTINAITNFQPSGFLDENGKAAPQLIQYDHHVPAVLRQIPSREIVTVDAESVLYFAYEIIITTNASSCPRASTGDSAGKIASNLPSNFVYGFCCPALLPKLPDFTICSKQQSFLISLRLSNRSSQSQKFTGDQIETFAASHRKRLQKQDENIDDSASVGKNYFVLPLEAICDLVDLADAAPPADENFMQLLPRILHRLEQLLVADEFRAYWATRLGLNTSTLSASREWPVLLGRSCAPERQEAFYGCSDDTDFFNVHPIDHVAAKAVVAEPPKVIQEPSLFDQGAAAVAALLSSIKSRSRVNAAEMISDKNLNKRTISMMSVDSTSTCVEVPIGNLTLLSQCMSPVTDESSSQVSKSCKFSRPDAKIADVASPVKQKLALSSTGEPLTINIVDSRIIPAAESSTVQQLTPPSSASSHFETVDGVRRRTLSADVQNLINQHHFDDPWFREFGNSEHDALQRAGAQQLLSDLRGPHPGLILQTLTAKSARDNFNLERLEMVGDSALNLYTSVYLFARFPEHDQGKLMFANHVLVSNKLLFMLAQPHGIGQRVIVNAFPSTPECNIVDAENDEAADENVDIGNGQAASQMSLCASSPSVFKAIASSEFGSKKFIDMKVVSDCAEALIGAYLVSCGPFVARLFMHAFGVNVFRFPPLDAGSSAEQAAIFRRPTVAEIVDEFSQNGLDRLIGLPTTAVLPDEVECAPELLVPLSRGFHKLELLIGYTLRDKSFLVQALTHQSFMTRNHVTNCYERLEVLGDAIVEYLVTVFIYRRCPHANPAKIHLVRKTLVGNAFFASIMVRNRIYRWLKMSCRHPSWRKMSAYAKYVLKQHANASPNSQDKKAALIKNAEEKLCCDLSMPLIPGDVVEFADEATLNARAQLHILCQTKIVDVLEVVDEVAEGKNAAPSTTQPPLPPKCLGDMLESIAGAVYVDSGGSLDACWRYLCCIMGDELVVATTPKKRVVRRRAKAKKSRDAAKPAAKVLSNKCGGDKNVKFYPLPDVEGRRAEVVAVIIGRRLGFCGVAKTEEAAREAAAQCALNYLSSEERDKKSNSQAL